ncbi:peptidoglycan DD-metalloendopeptidase family protein [Winogradskyella echinorum]|uniref:Peptidoglycan DD-metalloendopeptidase family protein n=1 Tax=Winogradskyella echinorum TaxID=538189 RepID=A0ABR6XYY0_9FLAO|nr:peptidoglycan DD-metalloendopeptidase family protein [Winogradskyella echinorum]MBC3845697.1 peptidoglycan DD-metalloendopeptidase family protein [Winogradskyella echinorum]MBC5750045.1 peptidoglycan DD-metalloendopeptidase family protein [Winogradskyella echinorum]
MSIKRFHITLVFALLLSCFAVSAQSDRQKKLEAQRKQMLREIKEMNVLLFSKKKEEKSAITLIEDLNYKVSTRKNLIRITNEQANLLTREINTNQKEITSLRTQLQELKDDYAAMVVKSYKSKSEQSKLMFLLSSDNFQQAYKRLQYIKQYRTYQKEQGEAIKSKTKELQERNIQLSKQKEDKKKLIEENRIAKRQLEKEVKEREVLMASIKSDMSKFAAQIKKKKQEADKLDREINRLVREAIAASNKKAGKKSSTGNFVLTPANKKLAVNFEANKGKLGWPVTRGVIKAKFGKGRSLTDSSVEVNNPGVKIATEKNAEVKAVFNGEVSRVVIVKNGNPAIIIRHGNYLTIYTNLSKIKVKSGEKVKTGQVIGEVFTSKTTGEALLGFRIYKNSQKLNPQYWLAKH